MFESSSIFFSPAPYHIISYGTLLGTQFFQSFVGGIVAYRSIPRPQFSALQQALFPVYFSLQTALPVVLALTYPGQHGSLYRGAGGPSSTGIPSGPLGLFAEGNGLATLTPLLMVFGAGLVNLLYVGPLTTKIMRERKHQETRDGKKSYDPAPHSKEMARLNKAFGKAHGASTIVNLLGFVATIWYGFTLASRIV